MASLGADVDRLGELLDTIGYQTHLLHGHGYMLSAICDSANDLSINKVGKWAWNKHGLITSAWQILDSIMDCDLRIL